VLSLELFRDEVTAVVTDEPRRYVLRRNPLRAQEMREARDATDRALPKAVETYNQYLQEHPRAKVDVALHKRQARGATWQITAWPSLVAHDRMLSIAMANAATPEAAKLDGWYVLKPDLTGLQGPQAISHARDKDLALVESALRSCKTVHLAMRPIYVRLAKRTRAHACVVMLAYHIIQKLARRWQPLNITVAEGIKELAQLCCMEVHIPGQPPSNDISVPRELSRQLLEAAQVRLPRILPSNGIAVATKKKLQTKRKRASIL
jgi:hypothetical protein